MLELMLLFILSWHHDDKNKRWPQYVISGRWIEKTSQVCAKIGSTILTERLTLTVGPTQWRIACYTIPFLLWNNLAAFVSLILFIRVRNVNFSNINLSLWLTLANFLCLLRLIVYCLPGERVALPWAKPTTHCPAVWVFVWRSEIRRVCGWKCSG